jgi:hypothetical protein
MYRVTKNCLLYLPRASYLAITWHKEPQISWNLTTAFLETCPHNLFQVNPEAQRIVIENNPTFSLTSPENLLPCVDDT